MKNGWLTLVIVLGVVALAFILLNPKKSNGDVPEEVAKCIGSNSVLYVQLGCHACETQEEIFGENYQHLTVIDCFFEREKCVGIEVTPTWEINGEKIKGVQTIDELKELTGC